MILSLVIASVIIIGTLAILTRVTTCYILKAGVKTKASFLGTIFFALIAGVAFGVFLSYDLGDKIKVQGIPIPLVVFVLEGERWTDFVKPPALGILCMVSNCLFPVGVASLIWLLAARATAQGDRTKSARL
jgi:L-cystine uptake protein TcyP (sodium:dicarboxylate symporter family)